MDKGLSHVIIETDSTNLVSALQSSSFDQAPDGVIFKEVRDLLDLHFVVKSICFLPRSCNQCAHTLAYSGLVRDPGNPVVWDDPLPLFVRSLVDGDRTDDSSLE